MHVYGLLTKPNFSCRMSDDLYSRYAALTPPGKLELVLDEENYGDIHLGAIADEMDDNYEATLVPYLEITYREMSDIKKGVYKDEPALQRYYYIMLEN